MTSISAVEYACRQASEYAESAGIFYCSAPITNGWEIATAIGTVGATVVAVAFGGLAEIRARREKQRADAAERRIRLQSLGEKVSNSFDQLAQSKYLIQDVIPPGNPEIRPYRELLDREGKWEGEFGSLLGSLSSSVIIKLEQHLYEYGGDPLTARTELGETQKMILSKVASTIRIGVNGILNAQTEKEKRDVVVQFDSLATTASEDMKEFSTWIF